MIYTLLKDKRHLIYFINLLFFKCDCCKETALIKCVTPPWSIKTHQYRFTIGVIPNYTKCVWKLRLYSFPVLSYAIQLYILTNRTTHLPQIPTCIFNFKIVFAVSDCLRNIFNCVLGVWLADLKWRFAFLLSGFRSLILIV
jgi:hypothetical protein